MNPGDRIRDCAVCGKPVIARPLQANSARACSPGCARMLAMREHPDLRLHPNDQPEPEPEKVS